MCSTTLAASAMVCEALDDLGVRCVTPGCLTSILIE